MNREALGAERSDYRTAGPAHSDNAWLAVMGVTTLVELIWWAAAWIAGIAPAPYVFSYLIIAFAALGVVLALRRIFGPAGHGPALRTLIAATVLIGIAASLFLPLKYAIPREIPFWLDKPLALAELNAFGAHPWLLLDRLLGWAAVPIDRVYALWLPVQLLALYGVMIQPASPGKTQALIAYSLIWFGLGVVAAVLCSSAGPIFYDRLYGGSEFEALRATLVRRGANLVLAESDAMWTSFASGRPGPVAGMSAVPSLHVAVSAWMVLAARSIAPRASALALAYCIFMGIASVQLGWHYVTDGVAGVIGALAIWWLTGQAMNLLRAIRPSRAE